MQLCKAPDRDVPKLTCGYPMPCPHHTALVILGESKKSAPRKARRKAKR
jgi:hypothetical protein